MQELQTTIHNLTLQKSINELNKQDSKTLEELAQKWKDKIFTFLIERKKKESIQESEKWNIIDQKVNSTDLNVSKEKTYQEQENQRINQKITSIKSIFTPSILSNNPDIVKQLNTLDSLDNIDNANEKEKIFQKILDILKTPWTLKSITDNLGQGYYRGWYL